MWTLIKAKFLLYRTAIFAALLLIALVGSFVTGWRVCSWRWEAKAAEQLQDQLEAKTQYEKLARGLVKRYQEEAAKKKVVYRNIKEKVYVETDGRLCFSDTARGLWNQALTGKDDLPSAATGTPETAGGASDTQVLSNAVENFEQYEECRRQLNSLIDWHEKQ